MIIENNRMMDHDHPPNRQQQQQLYNTRRIIRPTPKEAVIIRRRTQISKVFCISLLCIFVFVIERRWIMLTTLGDNIIVQRSSGCSSIYRNSNNDLILKNEVDNTINNENFNIINNNVDVNNKNLTSQQRQHNNQSHHHKNYYKGLAMTTAFNHKNDEFKGTGRPINATFDYIKQWYRSVQSFPNIKGAVIHNMFSQRQVSNWTTKQIGFVPHSNTSKTYARGINRPINDMRFFVLNTALWNIAKPENQAKYPPYVLISDAHDVTFLRNPFDYMETMDNVIGQPQLYVGEESLWGTRKFVYDNYMNSSSRSCFLKSLKTTPARMVNCGLIGGRTYVVADFLRKLTMRLDQATSHKVCDQISLFYTLKNEYQDKYISGYPFNTMFKKYETSNETDAYIAHK